MENNSRKLTSNWQEDREEVIRRLTEAEEEAGKEGHDTPDVSGENIRPFTDFIKHESFNNGVDLNESIKFLSGTNHILIYLYWSIFKTCPADTSKPQHINLKLDANPTENTTFSYFYNSHIVSKQEYKIKIFGNEFQYSNKIIDTIDKLSKENLIQKSAGSQFFNLKSDVFFDLYKPLRIPAADLVFVNYDNKTLYAIDFCSNYDRLCSLSIAMGYETNIAKEMEFFNKWFEPYYFEERSKHEFLYLYKEDGGLYTKKLSMSSFDSTSQFIKENYNDDIPYKRIDGFLSGNESGICLFHGEPGTGKTTLIKHFIAKKTHTKFVYCPSSLFVQASENEIANFMMKQDSDTVYIIEDCESLIADRNRCHNHILPTLLNFSDGIVGSALRPKFIMTFNCPESQVDKAVLRKGRLKIKYNFQKLSLEKTRAIKPDATEPMTLADIYNEEPNGHTESKRIGFSK